MSLDNRPHRIPTPVIRRLAKYMGHLRSLRDETQEWVSSRELARALGLTDATVRQDISYLDFSGREKFGYEVGGLRRVLGDVLGVHAGRRAVIVGAGNLGRALALHDDFATCGFDICGIFDVSSQLIGTNVGTMVVQDMAALPRIVGRHGVEIGILAVPAVAARTAALGLIAAGVKGILNLASAHLSPPPGVVIVDARLVESIQELSALMQLQQQRPQD